MSTSQPTTGADVATIARPPRDELFRALTPAGVEFREADPDATDEADSRPLLVGHFARFNEWTEIDSWFEGRFLERIAPGAFRKTLREHSPKVLFNHGHDPTMGSQVLGEIEVAREDDSGAYYEVRLFDGLPSALIEGLRAGVYGASFRFRVTREELVQEPKPGDHNPAGLPERTIKEVELYEFGPVTFPAYDSATAGVRSITDHITFERLARDETALRQLIELRNRGAAAEPHPTEQETAEEVRESDPPVETAPDVSAGAEPHPDRVRAQAATLYGARPRNESWRL